MHLIYVITVKLIANGGIFFSLQLFSECHWQKLSYPIPTSSFLSINFSRSKNKMEHNSHPPQTLTCYHPMVRGRFLHSPTASPRKTRYRDKDIQMRLFSRISFFPGPVNIPLRIDIPLFRRWYAMNDLGMPVQAGGSGSSGIII